MFISGNISEGTSQPKHPQWFTVPGPAKAGNYRPQTGMVPIQKVITALNTALNKSRNAADRKESKNRKREHAAPPQRSEKSVSAWCWRPAWLWRLQRSSHPGCSGSPALRRAGRGGKQSEIIVTRIGQILKTNALFRGGVSQKPLVQSSSSAVPALDELMM